MKTNKVLKRTFALLLCVATVFCTLPFSASAETATDGCYTYTVTDGKATIIGVNWSISSDVTIPSTLGGYPVTSIGDYAFSFAEIISVTIPDGVTSIGEGAFMYCDKLESITIPDSVTSIDEAAFTGCSRLASITVDKNNPNYSSDEYGVLFNKNKTELILYPVCNEGVVYSIPNSITSIDNYAFHNCKKITSITIPDSVTSIGNYAFWDCENLESVTIGNSVTSIGDWAFRDCDKLESITIPDSVTSIGDEAFYDCTSLTSITIPDSVTSIGDGAFAGTAYSKDESNWENDVLYIGNHLIAASITISGSYAVKEGTKVIADGAFAGCSSLTSITVDKNNPNYSSDEYDVLFNKNKTELIQYPEGNERTAYSIPDSVTSIGDYAFYSCKNLTSVTIPDSVTSIGDKAFYWSSISNIYYVGCKADWSKVEIGSANWMLYSVHYLTVVDTNDTVRISYDRETFDEDVEEVNLASQPVTPATNRFYRNGFYNKNMLNPISVLDVKIVDQNGNPLQPKDGKTITLSIKAPQEFNDLIESAIRSNAAFKDARLSNISFADGVFSFDSNGVRKTLEASKSFLNSFKITHWFSDGTNPGDYEAFTHSDIKINNGYVTIKTGHFSDFAICVSLDLTTVTIAQPSRTSISYGDSIVLHADTEYVPAGGYVKWTADNGNFTYTASSDGTTCTVTPKKSGSTTFTATVCDGEGNAIESATQQMTAKAGFFDKIIAFFKNLFGLTKVYPQMLGLEVK